MATDAPIDVQIRLAALAAAASVYHGMAGPAEEPWIELPEIVVSAAARFERWVRTGG